MAPIVEEDEVGCDTFAGDCAAVAVSESSRGLPEKRAQKIQIKMRVLKEMDVTNQEICNVHKKIV